MAASQDSTRLVKFLDAFFQEQNIKWLIGVGTLILLSSSTMLITSHWDSYPPLWKYAVFLGYTVLIHVGGQVSYHQLGLRKTGTGLMAATVLLIPLGFSAYRWVQPDSLSSLAGMFAQSGLILLLAGNGVFSFFAAKRIFDHLLRKPQITFLVCYLLLSFSGAVLPLLPSSQALASASLCWLVFAVGAIKINRHAFWLAAEHRAPRIFGFFPIILLAVQFLTLFAVVLAPNVPLEWVGLGMVLTALPILQASDALASVVQSRGSESSVKQPASVIIALFGGTALVMSGVFVAAYGFPNTIAIVPAAILAAVVMGLAGRRTRRHEFVWMLLLFVLTAYQCSPVFFKQVAMRLVDSSAAAIDESRMPFAFYGVTYLPLIAAASGLAWWFNRLGEKFFSTPMKHFSVALPILLLPVAMTHPKAMFPVSIALSLVLSAQTLLFRDRRLQVAALVACLSGIAGVPVFLDSAFSMNLSHQLVLTVWVVAGGILTFFGPIFDRAVDRLCEINSGRWNLYRAASLVIAVVCGGWTIALVPFGESVTWVGAFCLIQLIWHTIQRRTRPIGIVTMFLLVSLPLGAAIQAGWTTPSLMMLASLETMLMSAMALVLQGRTQCAPLEVFSLSAKVTARMSVLLLQILTVGVLTLSTSTLDGFAYLPATIVILGVGAELAVRSRSRSLVVTSWLTLLALSMTLVIHSVSIPSVFVWILAVWAGVSILFAVIVRTIAARGVDQTTYDARPLKALEWSVGFTAGLITLTSIQMLTSSMQVAGWMALLGLAILIVNRRKGAVVDVLLLLANAQILSGVLSLFAPSADSLFNLTMATAGNAFLPLALVTVCSAAFWERRRSAERAPAETTSLALQFAAIGMLTLNILAPVPIVLWFQAFCSVGTFLVLGWLRSRSARSLANRGFTALGEQQVWLTFACLAGCLCYFVWFGILPFGATVMLYTPLFMALTAWLISQSITEQSSWSVFGHPLKKLSNSLPVFTVFLGIGHRLSMQPTEWLGMNSLALLLAAGFYFWRGLEQRRSSFIVTASVILNVSLAMFWNELRWSDPQLFLIPAGMTILLLVELLREQIPGHLLNPLRYVGALTILVSPTFQIVGGSWLHIITLMITSLLVLLVSMGLRVKALMYTGTAFLVADLIALVVRGSFDHPSLLWLTGIAIGIGVIGLAAYCERYREQMLQRLRMLAAELETWT